LDPLKISTAQFENRSGDKTYNLSVIEELAQNASREGSDIIAFHECSVTGYTFARHLSKERMLQLAEFIPGGETILNLTRIAEKNDIVILAGLFEKDEYDHLYNTYICVNKNGLVARHRNCTLLSASTCQLGIVTVFLKYPDGSAGF
jgi:5-aminopentanamidase